MISDEALLLLLPRRQYYTLRIHQGIIAAFYFSAISVKLHYSNNLEKTNLQTFLYYFNKRFNKDSWLLNNGQAHNNIVMILFADRFYFFILSIFCTIAQMRFHLIILLLLFFLKIASFI